MGFDQNSSQPVVQLQKKTTKVNVGIIIGVILFFVIGGLAVAWFSFHPSAAHP